MKIALLISTYNWPEALELVLKSAEEQTVLPDEVLIADDGSKEETKRLIESFQKNSNLNIKHVWHEDNGFRRSAILNKTIAKSTSDYIIQTDGDCIIHKTFIEDHKHMADKSIYLFGSRVNIKEDAVTDIFKNKIFTFPFFASEIKNRTRNLRIPIIRNSYKEKEEFSKKTRGCNISYWRDDFISVNGYNENMEGWGREDSELILRLLNKGIKGKRLRYGGIIYHIHHPVSSKDNLERNNEIQEKTIQEKKKWCSNGIDKYLSQKA
jgi:glycosyltransferase involved in cell wall biosynthesis